MEFNYYYGTQADQFTFIKIPKLLITDEIFDELSLPAKVLYGILLDRMSLSMKNRWFDSENRVYIIYQISDIQEDLRVSKNKAIELLRSLEQFGRVEKKRRGLGMPSLLYVKSFIVKKNRNENLRSPEIETSASVDLSSKKGSKNKTSMDEQYDLSTYSSQKSEIETTRSLEIDTSRSDENETSRGLETKLQEVSKSVPHNNTNINNNNYSNTQSNHIILANDDVRGCDAKQDIFALYESLIKENVEFECLLQNHPYDRDKVEGIIDLIVETVMASGEQIVIASNSYPTEVVRARLLKLNYSHVEYVLSCLSSNTTKVKNIKKYLLAALYNAPATMSSYYTAEVNHDMPQFAGGGSAI